VCESCCFGAPADCREGGRREVGAFRSVEEDLARVCPCDCVLVERLLLVEALRRCREIEIGGLERSCLTGSAVTGGLERRLEVDLCSPLSVGSTGSAFAGGLGRRLEVDLCNPLVVGLPTLARGGGERIEALLDMLAVEAANCAAAAEELRVVGLTGSLLGD
jgi:hypothetical protein